MKRNVIVRRMSSLLIGMAILLACMGCSDARHEDTGSVPPAIEYLEATVAPCGNKHRSEADPCPPFKIPKPDRFRDTGTASVMWIDPLTIEDVVVYDLFTSGESIVANVVVRGMWVPDSIRCEMYPIVHGYELSHPRPDWMRETMCFRDFGVSDYIVGKGPKKITIIWRNRLSYGHEHSTEAELERWSEDTSDEIIRSTIADEPREKIYSLAPHLNNLAYVTWRGWIGWDIERDVDGEPTVVSGWLDYLAELGREITQQHIDHLTWPLEEFERRTGAYHETRTLDRGGGPYGEHRIVTDIYDIHRFHGEDVKPAYGFNGPISVPPPPAPGEPHSYPPLVALEPALDAEPTVEAAETQ